MAVEIQNKRPIVVNSRGLMFIGTVFFIFIRHVRGKLEGPEPVRRTIAAFVNSLLTNQRTVSC